MKKPSLIEEECRLKGVRLTHQRRLIARVLSTAHDHPDTEELHHRVQKLDQGIALSTVYRTLKLWADMGIIAGLTLADGRMRFEPKPDIHHDHLVNTLTGQVIEFRSEEIERLQHEIAAKLGFKLVDHRLELYGVPIISSKPKVD